MSKTQVEVIAALRIELDATKAELAKVVAERDDERELVARLGRARQLDATLIHSAEERAEKAERDLAAVFENLDLNSLNKSLDVVRRERDEARADVAAHSAPCSECKCQMRVCMDCAEAALAALRVERDALTKQVGALKDLLQASVVHVEGLHRACVEVGVELDFADTELEPMRAALRGPPISFTREWCATAAAREDLTEVEAERDSLRERLGDAGRVIGAAREYRDLQHSWSGFDAAFAEFDAKWGKR